MTAAAVFLPLLGAIIAGFFGRWLGDRGAQLVTCLAVAAAAACGVVLYVEVALERPLARWSICSPGSTPAI